MTGSIHSDQKCPICKGKFKDNGFTALICPIHPKVCASRFRVYFKGVTSRFKTYENAKKFLSSLQVKSTEGVFDKRDYRRDKPLGFSVLADKWLSIRKAFISDGTYRIYSNHLKKAKLHFSNQNVKDLRKSDFELFIQSIGLSSKSQSLHIDTVRQFFEWLYDDDEIEKLPKFPKIKVVMKRRKTLTKSSQADVLGKLSELTYSYNPKIWFAALMGATYVNVRPYEILCIKEKDIDLVRGEILIPDPKEREPKYIFLLDEDVEFIKSLPRGMPDMYFFRHEANARAGAEPGKRFGKGYINKWWHRACDKLGITGVSLYPGTRHTSAQGLRSSHSPSEIQEATGHNTSSSFNRYYQSDIVYLKMMYAENRALIEGGKSGKTLAKKICQSKERK